MNNQQQELVKGKRYWRWQQPKKKAGVQPKQGLKDLINKLIVIGMLLAVAMFFVLPLAVNPDIMAWLNSGNLIGFAVSMILLFILYSLNSGKYDFQIPKEVENMTKSKVRAPLPPQRQPSTRQQPLMQQPRTHAPKQIKVGVCDICEKTLPMHQLSGFEFEEDGSKVVINICKKCYRDAGYE